MEGECISREGKRGKPRGVGKHGSCGELKEEQNRAGRAECVRLWGIQVGLSG